MTGVYTMYTNMFNIQVKYLRVNGVISRTHPNVHIVTFTTDPISSECILPESWSKDRI